MTQTFLVLGIETSCDETAVALVSSDRKILSHIVYSQLKAHEPYGGVVPEIAARAHIESLSPLLSRALLEADVSLRDVDVVAATAGPGLIGGVLVGTMMAKAIAYAAQKLYLPINHLEGHALVARFHTPLSTPFLLLLVSGGHCQFLEVCEGGLYRLLGETLDDAAGECFDKIAQLLDLPYPGGPPLEKLALQGDPSRFSFPRPLKGQKGCHFSFSGLKTAVRLQITSLPFPLSFQDKADVAASFQEALTDCLEDKLKAALHLVAGRCRTFVLSGGVAANLLIRKRLQKVCEERGVLLQAPPLSLCTDNAVMIAWAAVERLQRESLTVPLDSLLRPQNRQEKLRNLDFAPRPRWPLSTL